MLLGWNFTRIGPQEDVLMKKQIFRFGPWVLLMVIGTIAVPRTANTAPAPVPPPEYPHMRAAANELREAKNELEHAAHDFCGHRADAVRATDAALKEINTAIACRR
jgi:hypothetical protein